MAEMKAERLNATNYTSWKQTISAHLMYKGVWKWTQEHPKPTVELDTKQDAEAKYLILSSMEANEINRTGNCATAKDLWNKVQENHEGTMSNKRDTAMLLFLSFRNKRGEDILDYCGRFEIALANILASGADVDESQKFFVFKRGLSSRLSDWVGTWQMANKQGKIMAMITQLKIEMHLKKSMGQEHGEESVAYYSGRPKPSRFRNRRPQDKPERQEKKDQAEVPRTQPAKFLYNCNYCGEKGHKYRHCPKLKDELRKKNEEKCQETPKTEEMNAYMALEDGVTIRDGTVWLADSGSSSHVTPNLNLLTNYRRFEEPKLLQTVGKQQAALGRGDFYFKADGENGVLREVLYVPGCPVNLMSTDRVMSVGYNVYMDGRNQTVKLIKRGKTVLTGRREANSLLVFHLTPTGKMEHRQEMLLLAAPIEIWHKRFAHAGIDRVKELIAKNAANNLEVGTSARSVCVSCVMGKMTKVPHPGRRTSLASPRVAILHFDTAGPMRVASLGKSYYFIVAVEEFSGYILVDFVGDKAKIPEVVKKAINKVRMESKRDVTMIVSDQGKEFVNEKTRNFTEQLGITHEMSSVYTPQQNGRSERAVRSLTEGARTLLFDSGLPSYLWAEAISTTAYALNRLLSSNDKTKTKYELYWGHPPDVGNMKVFGQRAIVLDCKVGKGKLEPNGSICAFVGYTERYNTFRFFSRQENKIVVSCNAQFLPTPESKEIYKESEERAIEIFPFSCNHMCSLEKPGVIEGRDSEVEPTSGGGGSRTDTGSADASELSTAHDSVPNATAPAEDSEEHDYEEIANQTEIENEEAETQAKPSKTRVRFMDGPPTTINEEINEQIHREINQRFGNENERPVTRSQSQIPLFKGLPDTGRALMCGEKAFMNIENEPCSYDEAIKSPDSARWKKAIEEELKSLETNDTWDIVDRPPRRNVIKSKWVFKKKLMPDGSIDKYKARMVAKGFSQVPGVDFGETYAPVASMISVRILLAIACVTNSLIEQFDIKTAFLHGDLKEEIYMYPPDGYQVGVGKVLRLKKSLYGLRQAPLMWNQKFNMFLRTFQLVRSAIDPCFYYSSDRNLMLVIYVDDGLVIARDKNRLAQLMEHLKKDLEVTQVTGNAYLSLEISRSAKRELVVSQGGMIRRLLSRFNMQECNPANTPEEPGVVDYSNSELISDDIPYKEAIGGLLYLATCTRPDIAHAVGIASRTGNPTISHWHLVKRIMRYLKGTTDFGILFKGETGYDLHAYSDANYANDVETRRSTSGYLVMMAGGPIVWRSQRQPIVALSSTESEYISGCEAVKELLPIRELLSEIGVIKPGPTKLLIDNSSTIKLANSTTNRQRTKHIDVRSRWLSEQVEKENVTVEHVPGVDQKADMLTKALALPKFLRNRTLLMSIKLVTCMLLVTSTMAYEFSTTSPVFYEESMEKVYFGDTLSVDLDIRITNVCRTYFEGLTSNDKINRELQGDCEKSYITSTFQAMHYCKDRRAGTPSRHKRMVPVVIALSVVAGSQIYSVVKDIQHDKNDKILKSWIENEREVIVKATKAIEAIRQSVLELNEKLSDIELELDKVRSNLESFPRIAKLVNSYEFNHREVLLALRNVDMGTLRSYVSQDVIKLIGEERKDIYNSRIHRFTHLSECSYDKQGEDFVLKLRYTLPVVDPKVLIMKSEAFQVWNHTFTNKWCRLKYAGPSYILLNQSSNCMLDMHESWFHRDTVKMHPCAETDGGNLNEILRPFHEVRCVKEFVSSRDDIQIKENNGYNLIYCKGHMIELKGKEHDCPDTVFKLPLTEAFRLNNASYEMQFVKRVTFSPVDQELNRQIRKRLRLDQAKFYGANMTMMNSVVDELMNSTSLIQGNVTLAEIELPKLLKLPFEGIMTLIENAWKYLQAGAEYLTIIAVGLIIVILMPFISILLQLIRIILRPTFKLICREVRDDAIFLREYWRSHNRHLSVV